MSHRQFWPTPVASSRRLHALEFIRRYFYERGGSPSLAEIAAALDTNKPSVTRILRELYRRGDIFYTPGQARSIKLPDRTGELSDTEVLELLRRRGWIVVNRGDVTQSQLPPLPA